jgi:hypothetical protein
VLQFQQNKEQLTKMMQSPLGYQLPLSPHLSIKAKSHFIIFPAATLIATKTAH